MSEPNIQPNSLPEQPLPVPQQSEDPIQKLMTSIGTSKDPRLVFDQVPEIAKLPVQEYAKLKISLKEIFGSELNMTDLDRAVREARKKAHEKTKNEVATPAVPYEFRPNGIIWHKQTQEGIVPVPLTNFTATILCEVIEDDGIEQRRCFKIQAWLKGYEYRFTIPATQFSSMHWVTDQLGGQAILYPGFNVKEHARTAIQHQSGNIPVSQVFTHMGWRKFDWGWAYLHGGGAIGQVGQVSSIEVTLPPGLGGYQLPPPPDLEILRSALRSSLRLLDVAPDRITLPLYAGIWRVVLGGNVPFSLHLSGETGVFKTELAALAQQHFGQGMNAKNLPGAWASTSNANEALGFYTKDALMAVDDYCPAGSLLNQQRLQGEADRLLRAQGNRAGRQRMRSDGTLQPPKPPRGLIVSTGEDLPPGASLQARILDIAVRSGDVKVEVLTECQRYAREGVFAQVTAGFIQWLALQYEELQHRLPDEVASLRQQFQNSRLHNRTPEIGADLAIGLWYFRWFAVVTGSLSESEAENLYRRGWQALLEAQEAQGEHYVCSDPVRRFLELLVTVFESGRGHLVSRDGTIPSINPNKWGWRFASVDPATFVPGTLQPQGKRLGYVEGDNVYLDPNEAFATVQTLAREGHESLPVTARTLWKRFKEKNLLLSVVPNRQTNRVRISVEGGRPSVLHLHVNTLFGEEPPIYN